MLVPAPRQFRRFFRAFSSLTILITSLTAVDAHAVTGFFEFGGGYASLARPGDIYGGSSATAATGEFFSLAAGIRLLKGPVPIHLGLEHRILLLSQNGSSVGLQATYPLLRMQWRRLYVGIGYTSFIWEDGASGGYTTLSGAKSFLGEAGWEFPITPEVSFNVGAASQIVTAPNGTSANSAEIGASFRFFFGGGGSDDKGSPGEFRGYRYPYGEELN